MIAITRAEHEGGGSVYGRDAHILVSGPPVEDGPDQWRRTLCHETIHLHNPQLVGFDSREMWYSEGFTDYYAHLLLARTGRLSGRDFLDHVRAWITDYRREAGSVGLREAGVLGRKNNTLIYQGGAPRRSAARPRAAPRRPRPGPPRDRHRHRAPRTRLPSQEEGKGHPGGALRPRPGLVSCN